MEIAILCEYSGITSQAFAQNGHRVTSCDLLPCEHPLYGQYPDWNHFQGDLYSILYDEWDMIIAFPPCTYLCCAQLHRKSENILVLRQSAIQVVKDIYNSPTKKIAIENPKGILSTQFMPPHQIISPHYFGSPYSKDINLWLKNLPPLISTCYTSGQKKVANHVNGRMAQTEKSKIKSKFFPEVAEAMATQWS